MIAERLFGAGERDFRWRGGAVARIETVADFVFALAAASLLISLEAPTSYGASIELFVQAPVLVACFALLSAIWFFQYRFQRRFGAEDAGTLSLHALLCFLVLLYAQPLRFLASQLYATRILGSGAELAPQEARTLAIVFGVGFALIFGVLAVLYARAYRQRYAIELGSVERVLTHSELHGHVLSAGVGAASVALAACGPRWVPWAGWIYLALVPLHGVHAWLTRRAVERFRGQVPTRSAAEARGQ
jgi:uncharacterized membrane protein